MASTLTPDSKEDQDQAYNPGELHAAEQFPSREGEVETHKGYKQQEATKRAHFTRTDPFIPADEDPSANIKGAQAAEKQGQQKTPWANKTTAGGDGKNQPLTIKGILKKKGPIGVLLALLGVGGFFAYTGPLGAVFIPNISAKNMYGNAERVGPSNLKQNLKYAIGNTKACEGNPTGTRCKLATSTTDTVDRFKEKGFKVETTPVKDENGKETGRHVITSITSPDGFTAKTGDEFVAHLNSSVSTGSKFLGIINARSVIYAGSKFSETVMKKFQLDKRAIIITGKDRDEIARSFNKEAKQPEDPKASTADTARTTEEDLKTKAGKIGGRVASIGGIVCGGYDLTRGALTIIKFKNALKYVAFGWLFFKLADQIRAGDADSATITAVATVLTTAATSGPNKGKTALDSAGFKAMMYGDRNKLSATAQGVLLGGNPALIALDSSLVKIKEAIGGGNVHRGCKVANDPLVGAALAVALCGTGGAAGGTVVPVLGNVVGGALGVVVCAAGNVVSGIIAGKAFEEIIKAIMPSVTDFLSSTSLSFNMDPTKAGDAIAIAGSLIFGSGVGLANGLKLGTKEEAQTFAKLTYDDQRQYEEIARYDARSTPFDATNQYSFMGQLVSKLGIVGNSGNPIMSTLSSVGSILSNAPSSLISNTFATEMPSPLKETTLGTCQDPELAAKNLGCDAVGAPQTVASKVEMNETTKAAIDYVEGNNYADKDGNATPGKDYEKYLKYCTGQEPTLPGTTALAVDDDDYDWPDRICQLSYEKEPGNEQAKMISNFRVYLARTSLQDSVDTQYTAAAANAGNAAAPAANPPGGAGVPGADIAGDDYKTECNKYGTACDRMCVDFVKFRLIKHKVLAGPTSLGDGKDVVANLGARGYKVDSTPAVHAVMSVPTGGVIRGVVHGHTAMVSQVNADGSIVVEEYNYTHSGEYDTRTITAQQIKDGGLTFAHTEVDYK